MPPSASPAPRTDVDKVSYREFRKHLQRTSRELKPLIKDIVLVAKADDLEGMVGAASEARGWAERERAWIDAHAPMACYGAVYDVWREAIGLMHEGLALVESGLRTTNRSEVIRGISLVHQGGDVLAEETDSPTVVVCGR